MIVRDILKVADAAGEASAHMDAIFLEEMPRSRVAVLLKQFSQLADGREPWRVAYPLAEVLLLLTCATIADCDDFDEIVAIRALSRELDQGTLARPA